MDGKEWAVCGVSPPLGEMRTNVYHYDFDCGDKILAKYVRLSKDDVTERDIEGHLHFLQLTEVRIFKGGQGQLSNAQFKTCPICKKVRSFSAEECPDPPRPGERQNTNWTVGSTEAAAESTARYDDFDVMMTIDTVTRLR